MINFIIVIIKIYKKKIIEIRFYEFYYLNYFINYFKFIIIRIAIIINELKIIFSKKILNIF